MVRPVMNVPKMWQWIVVALFAAMLVTWAGVRWHGFPMWSVYASVGAMSVVLVSYFIAGLRQRCFAYAAWIFVVAAALWCCALFLLPLSAKPW